MSTRKAPKTRSNFIEGVGRIDTLTQGAQKALGEFQDLYGKREGTRIYLAKADERGRGNTLRQKVNSIYKKGGRVR